MTTILLTGGTGYVCGHIALNLLKKNFSVIVFDSYINSSNKFLIIFMFLDKEIISEI